MTIIRAVQAGVINIGYSVGKDLVDVYEGLLHRQCPVPALCKKLCVVLFTQLLIEVLASVALSILYLGWQLFVVHINAIPLEVFYARTETAPEFLGYFLALYVVVFNASSVLVYQQLRSE